MATADRILDHYLAHRAFMPGFENRTVRSVLELLLTREREILGEIATLYEDVLAKGGGVGGAVPWSGRGERFLIRARNRVRSELRAFERDMLRVTHGQLRDQATREAGLFADVLEDTLPRDVIREMGITKIDRNQLALMVKTSSDRHVAKSVADSLSEIRQAGNQAVASVDRALTRVITDGASLQSATADVRRIVGAKRGSTLSRAAARFVRTRINQVANQSAAMLHTANSDLVRAEQFVATLDSSTCPQCGPKDGAVFPLVKGNTTVPRPPLHPNCRCFVIPVLKSWQQLGLPASIPDNVKRNLNGRAAQRVTWQEWVQKKPERMDIVLGPARARLVRQGKVGLDDLANNTRIFNLDEIAERRKVAA